MRIDITKTYRCCPHDPEAVRWNQYNKVVQCHRCGTVWLPDPVLIEAKRKFDESIRSAGGLIPLLNDRRKAEVYDKMLDVINSGQVGLPNFLDWIGDRLSVHYGEPPDVDFVLTCRRYAKALRDLATKSAKGDTDG